MTAPHYNLTTNKNEEYFEMQNTAWKNTADFFFFVARSEHEISQGSLGKAQAERPYSTWLH